MKKYLVLLISGFLLAGPVSAQPSAEQQAELETHWVLSTGYSVLKKESPDVKAAAEYAVSAQSAVTGEALKLLAIEHGRMISNPRMRSRDDVRTGARVRPPAPYELWLHVLKDAKPQSAVANVSQNTDGSYNLLGWSWLGDVNPGGQVQAQSKAQAADPGESVLSCEGKAPGPHKRPMLFKIELLQASRGEVTLTDESRAHQCKCAYVLDSLFDLSAGKAPYRKVNLRKQRCDSSCEADVVKHLNDTIRVAHHLFPDERYAVPFVGNQLAPCDSFSMDLERLRLMEHQRIDATNLSERVKQMVKDIKQMQGGYASPAQN